MGASGYLLKDMPPAELIAAILAVYTGNVLISPRIAAKLVDRWTNNDGEVKSPLSNSINNVNRPDWVEELSPRERQILGLIARGYDNREIAKKVFLAEQTIKNRVSAIYTKIGARDRVQAARMAAEAGLDEMDGIWEE